MYKYYKFISILIAVVVTNYSYASFEDNSIDISHPGIKSETQELQHSSKLNNVSAQIVSNNLYAQAVSDDTSESQISDQKVEPLESQPSQVFLKPKNRFYYFIGIGVNGFNAEPRMGGVNFGAGMQLNPYFGIETQVVVQQLATDDRQNIPDSAWSGTTLLAITANGYVPIKKDIRLFAKIGKTDAQVSYGWGKNQNTTHGITDLFGAGIEVDNFSGTESLRFGYEHCEREDIPGIRIPINYISMAFVIRF